MLLKNHLALPLYHHDFKANYLELSYQESHLKKFLDTLYASYDKLEANVDTIKKRCFECPSLSA